MGEDRQRIDRNEVREAARRLAPDQYVAALFAAEPQRADLMALAALWGETGRVALSVSDPTLGEIRLQWWADALAPEAPAMSGHPVADAVRRAVARYGLDVALLQQLIDSRRTELYVLPFSDEAEFDAYLSATDGAFFAMTAQVRGLIGAAVDELVARAALAWGRVRVGVELPYFAAMGRLPVWQEDGLTAIADGDGATPQEADVRLLAILVAEARKRLIDLRNFASGLPPGVIDAVLPIALMEPYLRALETKARDPLRDVVTIAPLTRLTRMGWLRFRGRL